VCSKIIAYCFKVNKTPNPRIRYDEIKNNVRFQKKIKFP